MKIANSEFSYSKEDAFNWYSVKLNTPPNYFDWWLRDIDAANFALGKLGWVTDKGYPIEKWMYVREGYHEVRGDGFEPLFYNDEFELIKRAMLFCKEEKLFLVEAAVLAFITEKTAPPIAFEFPISLKYEEITQGGALTDRLFYWCNGDYFIFGSSGKWAKFICNDGDNPVQVLVFSEELADIFSSWSLSKYNN